MSLFKSLSLQCLGVSRACNPATTLLLRGLNLAMNCHELR